MRKKALRVLCKTLSVIANPPTGGRQSPLLAAAWRLFRAARDGSLYYMGFAKHFLRQLYSRLHTEQTGFTKASFISLLIFSAVSCGTEDRPPQKLISENTYIDLMIELQLLRSYQAQSEIDSVSVDSLLQAIFKKYDVTSAQFKKSHRYYQNNLDKQAARIDSAIDRLRKDRIREADTIAVDSI